MNQDHKTSTLSHEAADAGLMSIPNAIAAVRQALVIRAHLDAAGAVRKLRDADAILTHWVMRIVAAEAGTARNAELKQDLLSSLHESGVMLGPTCKAMADAVVALETRARLARFSTH